MKITGQHIVQTDVATLWPMLQDEEVLAKISPGVSKITKESDDNYTAISEINIGPVRGSFEGDLTLTDIIDNETMTLNLSQKSLIGNAKATIKMSLLQLEDAKTQINYEGSAKVSGRLATMGQRILGGVIKTLSKQVFKELDKEIAERNIYVSDEKLVESNPAVEAVDSATPAETTSATKKEIQSTSLIQQILDKLRSIWK